MTTDTRQSLTITLSVALAVHVPGYAKIFQELHPEQADLARQMLDLTAQMLDWHQGQRELNEDAQGREYGAGVKVA